MLCIVVVYISTDRGKTEPTFRHTLFGYPRLGRFFVSYYSYAAKIPYAGLCFARAVPTSGADNAIYSCMICKSHTHAQRDCPAATVMTLDDPVLNAQASSANGGFVVSMALFSALILPLCLLLKGMTGGVQHLLLGDRKTTMFAIALFCMLMVIAVDAAPPDLTSLLLLTLLYLRI